MSVQLTNEDHNRASSIIGCPVDDISGSAPVRMYSALPGQSHWHFTGVTGVATVHFDTSVNAALMRVVDLDQDRLVLEEECYDGFAMQKCSDNFYAFESECTVGLMYIYICIYFI